MAPVYRFLICSRGAKLLGEVASDPRQVYQMAFDAVSETIDLGATPWELESDLRAYAGDIPPPVAPTIAQRDELVGEKGQLGSRGVIAGMVFAIVRRASYGARLKWFQSLSWWEVSCRLRGLAPDAQEDKKFPMGTYRGFEKVAEHEVCERLRGLLPIQPGDKSRACGVTSSAAFPVFVGYVPRRWGDSSAVFARRFRRPRGRATIRVCGWW